MHKLFTKQKKKKKKRQEIRNYLHYLLLRSCLLHSALPLLPSALPQEKQMWTKEDGLMTWGQSVMVAFESLLPLPQQLRVSPAIKGMMIRYNFR